MEKLLIVDDNPLNIKVLTDSLVDYEYELLTVNTGERALKVADMALPNLILLDINLPGLSGFEVCQKLKDNPKTAHIPIIFLSALDDTESKITGFKLGACDYITKPFNKEEVILRVETQMKMHQLKASLEIKNQELNDYLEELMVIQSQLSATNNLLLDSITYSQRIQNSILPNLGTIHNFFPESFLFYKPKSIVSGDFYYWYESQQYVFIIGADCTGHGVPGALMSIIGITFLDKIIRDKNYTRPASILNQLDREINNILKQNNDENSKDGMDLTVCALHKSTSNMLVSSAKRPFIIKNKGQLQIIKGDRRAIGGAYLEQDNFTNHEFHMEKGDLLYLFTDGYADQFGGPYVRKFQTKSFFKLIEDIHEQPMEIQKGLIEKEFNDWQGNIEQTDDVMLWGIRF